jgi:hypothetical protein
MEGVTPRSTHHQYRELKVGVVIDHTTPHLTSPHHECEHNATSNQPSTLWMEVPNNHSRMVFRNLEDKYVVLSFAFLHNTHILITSSIYSQLYLRTQKFTYHISYEAHNSRPPPRHTCLAHTHTHTHTRADMNMHFHIPHPHMHMHTPMHMHFRQHMQSWCASIADVYARTG